MPQAAIKARKEQGNKGKLNRTEERMEFYRERILVLNTQVNGLYSVC